VSNKFEVSAKKDKEKKMKGITKRTTFKKVGVFVTLVAMILTLSVPMMSFADTAYPSNYAGGVINIYKLKINDSSKATPETDDEVTGTKPDMTGRTPVAGAKFSLVPVKEVNATDYNNFKGDKYTVDSRYFIKVGNAAPTVSSPTDASGLTSFTGLKLGSYYITESTSVNGVTPAAPFVVNIPTTIKGKAVTTVNVYPKGYESKIEKETSAPGATASVGDTIDWTITATVPADFVPGGKTSFKVIDKPSKGLKFVDGSEVIKINGGTPLVKGTDYSVSPSAPYSGGTPITFTFLPAGLSKLSPGAKVTVKLDTEILDAALVNDENSTSNEASLDYTNSGGTDSQTDTDPGDKPSIVTGGLSFYKVDPIEDIGLAGAKFKLVKKSKNGGFEADLAAAKKDAHSDNDGYYKNISTGKTFAATSGGSGVTLGKFEFTGLAYGEYWLVETDAPNGYRLIGEPIAVTVGATGGKNPTNSYDSALTLADAQAGHFTTPGLGTPINTLTVDNHKGFEFPLTGGMGTLLFVVCGIALIGLAGIVIVSTRRKDKEIVE
jgi:fimbrial isopeptide formation D2 family protein